MANFDPDNCDPWTDRPGVYAIFNTDGQNLVDLDNDTNILHAWEYGDSMQITNPNQLWQFAQIGDKKWLIINQKSGKYLAAPDHEAACQPQTGYADRSAAHWRIAFTDLPNQNKITFMSVKHNGDCLEVKNGAKANGTDIRCATQSSKRQGQVWCVKRQFS